MGQLNGHVEEIYTGHNVVKVYNGEQAAQNTFDQINGKLYTCAWKSHLSGLMQPLMAFIGNLGYVAVCVVGAVLVKDGAYHAHRHIAQVADGREESMRPERNWDFQAQVYSLPLIWSKVFWAACSP